MTATITPMSGIKTARGDPELRRSDYRAAVAYYQGFLGAGIDRLVLVDNSNADLSDFEEMTKGQDCVFVSYQGPTYPPEWGYGYGEMELVQHAMDHAGQALGNDIVKVTGRYRVQNLVAMLKAIPRGDLGIDIRNRTEPWSDMRLFRFSPKGYEAFFRDVYRELKVSEHRLPPEMPLARKILGTSFSGLKVQTYHSVEPLIDGFRGNDGPLCHSSPA